MLWFTFDVKYLCSENLWNTREENKSFGKFTVNWWWIRDIKQQLLNMGEGKGGCKYILKEKYLSRSFYYRNGVSNAGFEYYVCSPQVFPKIDQIY